jgi:hypothetical protein
MHCEMRERTREGAASRGVAQYEHGPGGASNAASALTPLNLFTCSVTGSVVLALCVSLAPLGVKVTRPLD